MKSKELMIGDWVNIVPEEERDKTLQVQVDRIIPHNYNRFTIGKGNLHSHYDLITPIPLTAEILKANGFNDEMEWYINDNCILEYDTSFNHLKAFYLAFGDKVKYLDICIMYVHELQHALRLLELNELADNLKIQ